MIDIILYFGTDIILVRVNKNIITFSNSAYGVQQSTIDGLKINREGAIKEFPDLKDNPNWRLEAIGRFKDKIRDMKDEEEIVNYVIKDLSKFGYVAKYKQKQGFRREVIK